ncbi:MAG: ribbon-helix-helix protein, CopG family [Acidimicrobiia bacterium]|nr:ribbon-helix-helix protein, CopG family [Acidimicrobiia bacterium]
MTQRVRTGRPRLGSEPSTVESFRLDPSLKAQLDARAAETGLSTSEVIRIALRAHLEAAG